MPRPTPLKKLKSVLKSRASASVKATKITMLEPKLPNAAIDVLDDALDGADPILQVAIMDAYFEMTDDDYHKEDLERILKKAAKGRDASEEVYMAARLALGRINRRSQDTIDVWADAEFEIAATAAARPSVAAPAGLPPASITVMIHGTWAEDEDWWRPNGDFFEYVKKDLFRSDLYGKTDQFKWSGKNRESKRRKAGNSLTKWLNSHPAAEINIFAHSHGANVAMLATHNGTRIKRLVMLSPPVRDDYFAKWENVATAYNIQADFDPVVAIARGGQWFKRPNDVKEKKMKESGHSASHDPSVWRDESLGSFIGIPW